MQFSMRCTIDALPCADNATLVSESVIKVPVVMVSVGYTMPISKLVPPRIDGSLK